MEVQEVKTPGAGKGEVLIKLKAASLNHHELWSMKENRQATRHEIIKTDVKRIFLLSFIYQFLK